MAHKIHMHNLFKSSIFLKLGYQWNDSKLTANVNDVARQWW